MKKTMLMLYTCTLMLCFTLGGCQLPDDANTGGFVPNDAESALSDLTAEQRKEVKNLYGYYWLAEKNNCVEINEKGLTVYSYQMSFRYTNLKWKNTSVAEWECTAFHRDDRDYADENKKVVLTFVKKEDGSIELSQYVIPMKQTLQPFTKGKAVEKIEKNGETFYVYDKNNYSGKNMKMKNPKQM